MKTLFQKRVEVEERAAHRRTRTTKQQLNLLLTRPGQSMKETKRLLKLINPVK